MNRRQKAVIEAAIVWAMCPDAGGYREGPAIEDTCESLTTAVLNLLDVDCEFESPPYPSHWTVDEMQAALRKQGDRQ